MNEKLFYHTVLNRALLNGKAVKRRVYASVQEKTSPAKELRFSAKQSRRRKPFAISMAAIPVAAVLLICTLVAGYTVGMRALRQQASAASASQPPVTEQAASVHTASHPNPVDIGLRDLGCTVKLLPEFDEALQKECLEWRASMGGIPYRVEDWEWLRSTAITIQSLEQIGSRFHWTIDCTSENMQPFFEASTEAAGQSVELSLNSATYTVEGDPNVYSFDGVFSTTDYKPQQDRFMETWETVLDLNDRLPSSGIVTITAVYHIVDFHVEDMGRPFGSVGLVEHTFSYDAAKLNGLMPVPEVLQSTEQDTYRIMLLTELEQADRFAAARKKAGVSEFSEADWMWLKGLKPELVSMVYDGNELIWETDIETDRIDVFNADSVSPDQQHALIRPSSITFQAEHNMFSTIVNGASAPADENTIRVASYESDFLKNGMLACLLWQDKTQTVTVTYDVLDLTLGTDPEVATVAMIEHSFPVDKDVLLSRYGTAPLNMIELGITRLIGENTLELSEIHIGKNCSAVLTCYGTDAAHAPKLENLTFRSDGRPQIPAETINAWSDAGDDFCNATVFFPVDQSPFWPGNTIRLEGTLGGNPFSMEYTYPLAEFLNWTKNVKDASADALTAKRIAERLEASGSLVLAKSGAGYQNMEISHVLREGNVLYVLVKKDPTDVAAKEWILPAYSDFDEGFKAFIDGRPCEYAAVCAQDDNIIDGFLYRILLPYHEALLPEEDSLISFEGCIFRYNWTSGKATVPKDTKEYEAMRKESAQMAEPYCGADWVWRFRAEAEGFAVTDLVFHNRTMNGQIGIVLEETVPGRMSEWFDPKDAPSVTLDGIPLTFNAEANTFDPTLGHVSKDGKRCGYLYFDVATADLSDTMFTIYVTWHGKTASAVLKKADAIRLPEGDDAAYHDVFGY